MPKQSKIKVKITYTNTSNDKFNKILDTLTNWYIDELMKWFENHIKEMEQELIGGV